MELESSRRNPTVHRICRRAAGIQKRSWPPRLPGFEIVTVWRLVRQKTVAAAVAVDFAVAAFASQLASAGAAVVAELVPPVGRSKFVSS